MAALVSEQRVWRELTHFHFSAQQIEAMRIKQGAESNTNTNNSTEANKEIKERPIDWQRIYHALRRFVQFERNHIIYSVFICIISFRYRRNLIKHKNDA